MKIRIIIYSFLALYFSSCSNDKNLIKYVDPFIGSDAHGHVFVGANVPFGGVQVGPANFHKGWDWTSSYHYSDSIIKGFGHLKLSGTGIGDLGEILLMPATGDVLLTPGFNDYENGYASKYSKNDEYVSPGYYNVLLEKYNIRAELTATKRSGLHRYTFPKSSKSRVIINLEEGNGWDIPTETFDGLDVTYANEDEYDGDAWLLDRELAKHDGVITQSVTLASEAVLLGTPALLISKAQRGFLNRLQDDGYPLFHWQQSCEGDEWKNMLAQFLAGMHLTDAIVTESWPDARSQLAEFLSMKLID